MTKASDNKFPKVILEEVASDGSTTATPDPDFRALILGEDGALHLKDSSAAVTDIGGAGNDLVQVASGAGSIIIPGLSASPDIRVAGVNDDEFDVTDTSNPMTGWSTLGVPLAHDINSTVKSHYTVSKDAGSLSLTGIYKGWIPSNGNMVTTKLSGFGVATPDAQCRAGLFVSEASPGKVISIGRSASAAQLSVDIWTNPTTYASSPGTTAMYGSRLWLRIIYNSSTSLTYQWSHDGLFWFNLATAHNPSTTIAAAGLMIDPNASGSTVYGAFDWIRFS
jgi:hypothetical protein